MKSVLKKIKNIFLSIILFLLIATIAFVLIVRLTGDTPSIGGYMLFRVSSSSMEPELKVGDIILTQEISDITEIKKDDIITYHGTQGSYSGKLITHKVVIPPYEEGGNYYLVTKGVANPENDPQISADQVVGKMLFKIPLIGLIYSFFLTPWGLFTAILIIFVAFGFEFWNIYKSPSGASQKSETSTEAKRNRHYIVQVENNAVKAEEIIDENLEGYVDISDKALPDDLTDINNMNN